MLEFKGIKLDKDLNMLNTYRFKMDIFNNIEEIIKTRDWKEFVIWDRKRKWHGWCSILHVQ